MDQYWGNANTQTNYENQETSQDMRPLKGYKNQNQNMQNQNGNYDQQVGVAPLKGYKQMNQASGSYFNQQNDYIPKRGYQQHNKKHQSEKTYYNQQMQVQARQTDQGCYSDQQQQFGQYPERQNREQYNRKDNQSRGYYNTQNNAGYQQNKNYQMYQLPQQSNNIFYQFQTQFLRANDYYDMNELRANFNPLKQLNKNHMPSQDSHFVLIRPKNGFQNIHKAIKYGIWCSSSLVNQELSQLYADKNKSVYLIFFPLGQNSKLIGIAQMISDYDPNQTYKYWDNDGIYNGSFELIWHSIKYVDPESIPILTWEFRRGDIRQYYIQQLRDGNQIGYHDAMTIFEIFNEAPENPSVFEHFNVLDIQEDQKRSNKLKNQEEQEFQLKQKGLKKKYQY